MLLLSSNNTAAAATAAAAATTAAAITARLSLLLLVLRLKINDNRCCRIYKLTVQAEDDILPSHARDPIHVTDEPCGHKW